jgi:serine/threonine protein phosphatase 1
MMWAKGIAKTFVIGYIHGAYRSLRQCLEQAEFDFQQDALICLGDVCDGWPETKHCVYELLKIQNLTFILGIHDLCAMTWMSAGNVDDSWLNKGGMASINSYRSGLPEQHVRFFKRALPFYVQDK